MKREDVGFAIVLVSVLAVLGIAILGLVGALIVRSQETPVAEVGDGLRDVPVDCWDAPDLYNCLAYREPQ